jgi:hypothetical protein
MCIGKIIKIVLIPVFLALFLSTSVWSAGSVTVLAKDKSNNRAAGFSFTRNGIQNRTISGLSVQPVVRYEQNIHMLSSVDDRPSLQIFGDGHVLVHYPLYMKMSGDYEMQLKETELIDLLHSLSGNGVMNFDTKKHKVERQTEEKALKAKGQFFAISDTVGTTVEIRLDEYQRNRSSKKVTGFYKKFNWNNLEQDAKYFKSIKTLALTNQSINEMKALMKDARLVNRLKK